MNPQIISAILFCIIAIISMFVLIAIKKYDKENDGIKLTNEIKNDWLFKDFQSSIVHMFYKTTPTEKFCGIDIQDYERDCKILHIKPNIVNYVALRIEGMLLLLLFGTIAAICSYNITVTVIFLSLSGICFYFMYIFPLRKLKSNAEERLFHIKDDLPRFLSLLEKAMDLPIDQAILMTASKFESPLAEDLMDSIHKVSLGANGWQETLLELAQVYNMESFSDLILEIINSYEQGMNIRPLVNRKSYEMEQNRLYDVEAHDSKIKSLVFLPVIGLKVLPLMALICLPMLTDFL